MGAGTILGSSLGIGLAFAFFASIFSGHDRVRFAVFAWVIIGWLYIVPHALRKALIEINKE